MKSIIEDMYSLVEERELDKNNFDIKETKSEPLGEPTNVPGIPSGKLYHNILCEITVTWKSQKTGNNDQRKYQFQNGDIGWTEFKKHLDNGDFD